MVLPKCTPRTFTHSNLQMHLTHVRHHWRETALMFPSLWCTINVTRPEVVDACTSRSGVCLSTFTSDLRGEGAFQKLLWRLRLGADEGYELGLGLYGKPR